MYRLCRDDEKSSLRLLSHATGAAGTKTFESPVETNPDAVPVEPNVVFTTESSSKKPNNT
jgi:hypothetical protein